MPFHYFSVVLLVLTVLQQADASPFPNCTGSANYQVTFYNFLTPGNFGDLIPESRLVFSPLAGLSHSGRISFFTVRGFANRVTKIVAEKGNNKQFIKFAGRLRSSGRGVLSVADAGSLTKPGSSSSIILPVNCQHSFLTVLGMIAPSPDWIVQINNHNVFNGRKGRFVRRSQGDLIAYDAGVDDGREFTPPSDTSLDLPTVPQKNISPLVEDETDRFEGRVVGKFVARKI